MKCELRKCLSINGQELQGVDIKNSQPLFSTLVAIDHLTNKTMRSRMRSYQPNRKPPTSKKKRSRSKALPITMGESTQVLTLHGTCKGNVLIPEDLAKCLQVCENGRFYESLMPSDADQSDERYRKKFKKMVFRDVFYGDYFPNPLASRMWNRFPSLLRVLCDLKRKDYRRPSWLMQARESKFVIDTVCRRIMSERPDVPLVTIHDSIMTTPGHLPYVECVMRDEFAKIGVSPTLELQ